MFGVVKAGWSRPRVGEGPLLSRGGLAPLYAGDAGPHRARRLLHPAGRSRGDGASFPPPGPTGGRRRPRTRCRAPRPGAVLVPGRPLGGRRSARDEEAVNQRAGLLF